jgi:acyl-CoA reductase-like NAD-dependent aldehyde dehydrogenase
MSYCPADGRVLGNGIKPATVEDVNDAVQAAKAAQREWAKTSFAERRKVLRTLLKYDSPRCTYCILLNTRLTDPLLLDTSSITKRTS